MLQTMKDEVQNIINNVYPISEQSFSDIGKLLEHKKLTKGDVFISKNKKDEKEYFVLSGICKSYLVNLEGDEVSIGFFQENTILSPHSIRTLKNISFYYFKALTNMELATIKAREFERLMIENVEIRNFGHTVLQNELKLKIDKEIGLASLSARERLIKFRETHKGLENLIPHTDIASYLGITNISLSRLRKDL